MGRGLRGFATGLALVGLLVAAGSAAAGVQVIDRIVATVDGWPITSWELDQFVRRAAAGAGADPALVTEGQRRQALDSMINDVLIQRESTRLGLSVPESEIDAYIEQIKRQNGLDDETLALALQQQGLTLESYREQVRKEILKNQLVGRQIRRRVNVTPEEVERYYQEHLDEFAQAAAIKVRQIFFALPPGSAPGDVAGARARLVEAERRLAAGEDFAAVARDLSDGPEAADGGMIGWMRKGEMLPELEAAAFRLKPGQVSDPLQSPAGIHLLRVDEVEAASHVPLEQVRDQIKERLYGEAVQARFKDWVEKDLRAGHAIVIRL